MQKRNQSLLNAGHHDVKQHIPLKEDTMDHYSLSMTVLHKFLDTARAYLGLARHAKPAKTALLLERRSATRLLASNVSGLPAFQKTEYRENVPA
ncbi:MAG TPA: hypothetical protein VN066_09780 [Rhodocyclaceae bacterium]|nr:hypothetical protein [Rhodocyclaceae bacterium]